jgi:hypothetical protein
MKMKTAQINPPPPLVPNPLLSAFLPHRTTLYTASNTELPCTIDPLSSRSFITSRTLKSNFPPLEQQDSHTPLLSVVDGKAVKTNKFVRLKFAFKETVGERVELVAECMVSEQRGLEGRVLLGVDFLRGCGGVVRCVEKGGGEEGGKVLVLGKRRVVLE